MTTLTDLPVDIHMDIMLLFKSPATLEAYLVSCPSSTGIFLAYFRRIVQSALEASFEPERLRLYFYSILIAHFDNPSYTNTVPQFLARLFDLSTSTEPVLPSCVPHTMEALEYIVSVQLALDYFYPCAEDSLTDVRSGKCTCTNTLNRSKWDWDMVIYQSRRCLLRVQLEAELFHHYNRCWNSIPQCRFLWERYHQADIRECRKVMSVLAHWMRQKLGLDAIRRSPETHYYVRVLNIEPPRRLNCLGLPQLHQVAEDGPYAEWSKRYALRFLAQKALKLRDEEVRVPPRPRLSCFPISVWDREAVQSPPTDSPVLTGYADSQVVRPFPVHGKLPT